MNREYVEEIQGLYGPFSITERLVQRIWFKQDFERENLMTVNGRALEVLDPGIWNLNEGPDFTGARLLIDGRECSGDVEIHFYARDWFAHGHETNSNFNRVVLHVVLFGPDGEAGVAQTQAGHRPETFVLLPILNHDLESYAMDVALLELESQDVTDWEADFGFRPLYERFDVLDFEAKTRWEQKVAYAKKRLESGEWSEVCHQWVMEVLGSARNRAPMSRIALRYPIQELVKHSVDDLYADELDAWKLSGLRPANHPKKRLEQYISLLKECPEWPNLLLDWASNLLEVEETNSTRRIRHDSGMQGLFDRLKLEVFANTFSSSRLSTICVDTLFPLLAHRKEFDVKPYWMHWYPGDMPDALREFLKRNDLVDRENPYANGRLQAVLALMLKRGHSSGNTSL